MPQKIAAGNWKMNGTQASLSEIQAIAEAATPWKDLRCPKKSPLEIGK